MCEQEYCPEIPNPDHFPQADGLSSEVSDLDAVSGASVPQPVGRRSAVLVSTSSVTMQKTSRRDFVSGFFRRAGVTLFLLFLFFMFVGRFHRVSGNAMYPSLRDGDLCFVSKLSPVVSGDIVCYQDTDGKLRFGRIVAVAGQTVSVQDDGSYQINGAASVDKVPYLTYPAETGGVSYPCEIGDGEYFVLNDFREDTSDSREFDVIEQSDVEGRVFFQFRRREF